MKNMLEKVQNSQGFISIEAMVLIGVLVLVAAIIIVFLFNQEKKMANSAATQMTNANAGIDSVGTAPIPAANATTPFTP